MLNRHFNDCRNDIESASLWVALSSADAQQNYLLLNAYKRRVTYLLLKKIGVICSVLLPFHIKSAATSPSEIANWLTLLGKIVSSDTQE